MTFTPCAEASGQLPVTRYKVKVEEAATDSATTERVTPAANDNGGDAHAGSFACPTLAELVLTPLGVGAKPPSFERERKLVTVRGLKPATSYRVQVRLCLLILCSRGKGKEL